MIPAQRGKARLSNVAWLSILLHPILGCGDDSCPEGFTCIPSGGQAGSLSTMLRHNDFAERSARLRSVFESGIARLDERAPDGPA
jgi:hypothetical protein